MAAAKLVTRCPACRTAFRLVADQLRLRQGLVRCGQCDTVFDAREHLIEVPAPAGASTPVPAADRAPPSPAAATSAATTAALAAALAHAEQTQAWARARETDTPFDPGFDPGYEVPALDSPTTMMSEPDEHVPAPAAREAAATEEAAENAAEADIAGEERVDAGAARADSDGSANTDAPGAEADAEATPDTQPPAVYAAPVSAVDTTAVSEPEPAAEASAPAPEPAATTVSGPEPEMPLTEPPAPWPTLDHSAFDDEPAPSATAAPAPHSSLDPAAAYAPTNPSSMPPYGAYSARATWPPLRPADAPATRPMPEPDAPAPEQAEPEAPESAGVVSDRSKLADGPLEEAHRDAAADLLQASPEPFPQADPVPSASGFLRAEDPADPEAEAWAAQARDVIEHDLGVTLRDGTPDAVARETTTRHWQNQNGAAASGASAGSAPSSGPGFAPDFLRHTREREQARTPRGRIAVPGSKRTWLGLAAGLLGLGILVQGVYLARSQIAGNMPVLRPVLEAACAPFGCDVPPWRDLEALRIDSSQLQKEDESSDVYLLAVTLRNQGRATTALPAIELVMTDLQDQLLLRRVLPPAEYLEPAQRGFAATGLRAGSELPVRVRFRTQQAAANYRVLIFYP